MIGQGWDRWEDWEREQESDASGWLKVIIAGLIGFLVGRAI